MSRTGFTLVELLVVVALIGVLMGLLLPAVQAARESARRSSCANNMKQLGLGLHLYHEARGTLPYGANTGSPHSCWFVDIMPFIEQQDLASQLDPTRAYDNNTTPVSAGFTQTNKAVILNRVFTIQRCPSNPNALTGKTIDNASFSDGLGSHAACYGASCGPLYCDTSGDCPSSNSYCSKSSLWHWDSTAATSGVVMPGMFSSRTNVNHKFKEVVDGLSSTLMLCERRGELTTYTSVLACNFQGVPSNLKINSPQMTKASADYKKNMGAASLHSGGAMFCMGDGATVFLADGIDFQAYNYLGNKGDGTPTNLSSQ